MEHDLLFDIVICVGPHDSDIIEKTIPFTKKNIIGYRNIYLVSCDPNIKLSGTITIDENIYPFTKKYFIEKFGDNSRNGWYLQQLLKMYAGNVIPGILKRYLVIDSDTYFLKPINFITNDGKHCLTRGYEYHDLYFKHMNKLHPALYKHPELNGISGISHHMFFNNDRLNDLFKMVETYHSNGKFFWELMIDMIDKNHYMGAGYSEYEIYFNYMFLYHKNDIIIRNLKWQNLSCLDINNSGDNDFVSIHWYIRK
jgi:hypothetical protein